jgi:hypothetical protein
MNKCYFIVFLMIPDSAPARVTGFFHFFIGNKFLKIGHNDCRSFASFDVNETKKNTCP